MYIVRTSARAFLAALVPLAIVHALLLAMGLLGYFASPRSGAALWPSLPTPDTVFLLFVARLALDGSLLYAGHLHLRRIGIGSRIAYGVMGGLAAALGYVITSMLGLSLGMQPEGTVVTAGLLPTFAGMISGFLYSQFAGHEPVAEPEPQPAGQAAGSESPVTAARPSPMPPPYDGPVQVRTSIAAVAIAALVPGVCAGVITLPISLSVGVDLFHANAFDWRSQAFGLALPAQLMLTALIASFIPSAILVLAVHGLARSFGRTSGRDYAAIGAVAAVLVFGAMFPFLPFLGFGFFMLPTLVIGGLMGALYRRFAGLQPLRLPEIVLVNDMDDIAGLVPEDHPARKAHAIVVNG